MIQNMKDRETLKDKAVTLREKGELEDSLKLFDEIISWDDKNNNLRGKLDVLGHKRIAFSKLSNKATKLSEKQAYAKKATEIAEQTIKYGGTGFPITKGVIAAQYIHLASAYFDESNLYDGKDAAWYLKRARECINIGLENYEGPIASHVWPLGIKARIIYAEGKIDEAFDLLCEMQKNLFAGYDIEAKAADQMDLKYRVWFVNILKTAATICDEQKKPFLAEMYWGAIAGIPDPDNILKDSKLLAQSKLTKN